MRIRNEEQYQIRKEELMVKCYECMAENGLSSVSIRMLAKYCDCNVAVFYNYFVGLDDLITQSTEYCMSKVEDDFMALAPADAADLERYINEIPYWTAKKHGAKYRLMYQVYTHPKYRKFGKQFFDGVNQRYTEYAMSLEPKLGLPYEVLTPFIFILIRACVHYALFEDEFYLQAQLNVLLGSISLYREKYASVSEKKELHRSIL